MKESQRRWVVVVATHIVLALSAGASSVLGILLNAWVDYFDASVQEISTMIALTPIIIGFACLGTGLVCSRLGYRPVALVGALFTVGGWFGTVFAQSLTHIYISFSFIAPIGVGILYASSILVIGSLFTNNTRQLILANGITFAGLSTGQVVLPPLVEYLFSRYGWRGGLAIFCGVKAHVIACCVLYHSNSSANGRDRHDHLKSKLEKEAVNNNDSAAVYHQKSNSLHDESKSVGIFTLCRNLHYILCVVALILMSMVALGGFVFMVPRATDVGIDPFYAAILVTISGVTGAVGTLGHSILINKKYISAHAMFLAGCVTCALTLFVNPLSDHPAYLTFNAILFALTIGVVLPLASNPIPRLVVEYRTPSLVEPALGFLMLTGGVSQGVGMILAGVLHDIVDSYTLPYLVFGGLISLALVTSLPILRLMRNTEHNSNLKPSPASL